MTINNKHVGWGITVLLLSSPWTALLFTGGSVFNGETDTQILLAVLRMLELGVVGVVFCILLFSFVHALITDDDGIEFEWHINLPKRKPLYQRDNISDKLHRFGQLDRNDPEYDKLYSELKQKGVFG